jgi:hypothetical protein
MISKRSGKRQAARQHTSSSAARSVRSLTGIASTPAVMRVGLMGTPSLSVAVCALVIKRNKRQKTKAKIKKQKENTFCFSFNFLKSVFQRLQIYLSLL